MAWTKIKHINDNVVQSRLSENYLTQKIIAWNIKFLDTKYSRFTVTGLVYVPVNNTESTRVMLYTI